MTIEKLGPFKVNRFYSSGSSVRVEDLEEAVARLTDKVNEIVEAVNEHVEQEAH